MKKFGLRARGKTESSSGIVFVRQRAYHLTGYMEFTCGFWYKNVLVHYLVSQSGTDTYSVRLLNCISERTAAAPPRRVLLQQKAGEWISDQPDSALINGLITSILENTAISELVAGTYSY